jgi:hypothetical protein
VLVPEGDEPRHHVTRAVETRAPPPRLRHDVGELDHLVADAGGQREDRLFHVAEVLVEGCG